MKILANNIKIVCIELAVQPCNFCAVFLCTRDIKYFQKEGCITTFISLHFRLVDELYIHLYQSGICMLETLASADTKMISINENCDVAAYIKLELVVREIATEYIVLSNAKYVCQELHDIRFRGLSASHFCKKKVVSSHRSNQRRRCVSFLFYYVS